MHSPRDALLEIGGTVVEEQLAVLSWIENIHLSPTRRPGIDVSTIRPESQAANSNRLKGDFMTEEQKYLFDLNGFLVVPGF